MDGVKVSTRLLVTSSVVVTLYMLVLTSVTVPVVIFVIVLVMVFDETLVTTSVTSLITVTLTKLRRLWPDTVKVTLLGAGAVTQSLASPTSSDDGYAPKVQVNWASFASHVQSNWPRAFLQYYQYC